MRADRRPVRPRVPARPAGRRGQRRRASSTTTGAPSGGWVRRRGGPPQLRGDVGGSGSTGDVFGEDAGQQAIVRRSVGVHPAAGAEQDGRGRRTGRGHVRPGPRAPARRGEPARCSCGRRVRRRCRAARRRPAAGPARRRGAPGPPAPSGGSRSAGHHWSCGGSVATIGVSASATLSLAARRANRGDRTAREGLGEELGVLLDRGRAAAVWEGRLLSRSPPRGSPGRRRRVDTFVGMDVEHPCAFVGAVDGRSSTQTRSLMSMQLLADHVRHACDIF